MHASAVAPEGRAYLTCLERMLGVFGVEPFKPRHAPRGTNVEIDWWRRLLSSRSVARPIPGPVTVLSIEAYSDASSLVGIGIWIEGRWHAWTLQKDWRTRERQERDIGWAEAVGFELLIYAVAASNPPHNHIRVYGNNQGVVEGWRNGCSRNPQVNTVFRRIHAFLKARDLNIYASYVQSKHNPADEPSRGVFPPQHLLLPPIPLPAAIKDSLVAVERQPIPGHHAAKKPRKHRSSLDNHKTTERYREHDDEAFRAVKECE